MEPPRKLKELLQAVLAEGARFNLPATTRAALAALGGAPVGGASGDASPAALSPELARYAEKVARHAYRVQDEDVAALRASGLSEESIFEGTLAIAVGAGWARMEALLRALRAAAARQPKEGS